MDRNAGTMLLCLLLGAAVMYGSTNYRIQVAPVGAPEPKAPVFAPLPAPQPLPADVVRAARGAGDQTIRDEKMRPASGEVAVARPAPPRITLVTDGQLLWAPPSDAGRIPAVNSTVTLSLERLLKVGDAGKGAEQLHLATGTQTEPQIVATDDPNGLGAKLGTAEGVTTVTLDLVALKNKATPTDKANGVVRVELWVRKTAADDATKGTFSESPARITLLVPSPPVAGALSVQVNQGTNSPYLPPVDVPGTGVEVFGKPQFEPYLRLYGNVLGTAVGFKFVLQPLNKDGNAEGAAIEVESEPDSRNASGAWDAKVKLPVLADGAKARLYVRAEFTSARLYAPNPIPLTFRYIPESLDVPELGRPTAVDSAKTVALAPSPFSTPGLPAYFTNTTKFNLTVTKSPANAQVLVLYVDGDKERFPGIEATANPKQFTNIEVGQGRDHVIRVAAARGRFVGPATQIKLLVESVPPGVDSVAPQPGFGSSKGVGTEKILVRFNPSNPIDWPGDASGAKLFGVTQQDNTPADQKKDLVQSAKFDAATNTVTLNVGPVQPGAYKVVIRTSATGAAGVVLKDVFGNPMLAAESAVSGGTLAEFTVSTQGPAPDQALASRTVGITHQTGPPVEFPEYVKFRISPDGFNPSDRVETRVVRLYYYRDAHRVAQLINRTVKSYNAAAVDVRRRMADAVRDNADKAEDDRKTLEARAVRAAQEARAAEAQLANLQNGIATARNQSATARIELLQRQQELEQAKRDLAREELLTPGRTNSDAVLEGQRQTIDMLDRDLVQLDLAIGNTTDPTAKAELDRRRRDVAIRRDAEKRKLDALLVQSQTRSDAAADAARARVRALETEIGKLQGVVTTGDLVERANADRIAAAQSALAAQRELEAKAVEAWQVKELQERRLRENQFRQETAAAREDPDTYAPGNPNSVDAVMQVSVSVIGEGLIQLRGPIKGLNVIRTMVNQIDAPVGQVRVAVHTLQVNGERADRMEKVVANIQRYLDHSRFLTTQSGQMLRNAVTSVASRKAAEVQATLAPGCTQWDRDQRYLYAFFGKDFIDELIQLDSEFLKTGNKLLSLNSMDSTSLSSALFLLALAKNDVRTEILNEFLAVVQRDLPEAEWKYYVAGISQPKHCDACKDKKMYLLAFNSQFQSLVGFFNAQVTGTDTLNPLQREFVKLAQIFKARMVTEMQLRQRVMERALLEERVGTEYLTELKKAKELEDAAKEQLAKIQGVLQQSSSQATLAIQPILAALGGWEQSIGEMALALDAFDRLDKPNMQQVLLDLPGRRIELVKEKDSNLITVPAELLMVFNRAEEIADEFNYLSPANNALYLAYKDLMQELRDDPRLTPGERAELRTVSTALLALLRREETAAKTQLETITSSLTGLRPDPAKARALYITFRDDVLSKLRAGQPYRQKAEALLGQASPAFDALALAVSDYQVALKNAQAARRPIDEKKLLDMLVDEMEDKFVEILEGTRAHTSNVDNYLKSISTALDDDFNTQYYLPSFRRAREASRYWDVTLSQIETTSVLTNNRSLGKVSPAATFEFDLPKRDILLTEGFRSAKALFDEYGALMNDPSFLALAKIYSGNPVSMMQQGGGGLSAVRNVLPGLPTSADEKILAQAGPGRQQFGAALDGLIPDPAIYKFETGTGYEIRPVLSPDGQAVVFGFDYMYTTDVREPVRADEKHLGRVKRHFVSTDVQLGNYELREVSKYMVSLKVARTGKGVQLLQDIPGVGVLFRPLPSAGSSLQQNLIYSQATIFPTMFDLMGLRYAPAVADLDPLADRMSEFAARYRRLDVEQRVYDIGSTRVDDALRTPYGERRYDLYRPQVSLPFVHPNGYTGLGLRLYDGTLREGYDVNSTFPDSRFAPGTSLEGRPKPYNFAAPDYPGADAPFNSGPGHLPGHGPEAPAPNNGSLLPQPRPYMEMPKMPYANPLDQPRSYPPPMTAPTSPGANSNIMKLPGMGAVGVGRPIPYNPALSTTPPPLRPSELPATNQRTVVTPGGPPVPRPSTPTALPPVRPQPVGLPPAPPVPTTTTGSR